MFKLREFANSNEIDWDLSQHPNAIQYLEQNLDKNDWEMLSTNPSIFELDYNAIKVRCCIYKEELMMKALHPSRIAGYLEIGMEMEDLDNYI
jgi:hypothetical protein